MDTTTPQKLFSNEGQKKSKGQCLLIIDDEPAILFAYQKLFEREGYAVDLCDSLDQSMQMIQERPYFAVISDMRFEGTDNEDGIKVLCSIREKQPEAKVILVSGTINNDRERTCQNLGISFFYKPVEPKLLLNALKNNK